MDHTASISEACSQISLPYDPNFGKALAALLAASLQLKNFTLEGDSLIVISALQFLIYYSNLLFSGG
jgi:hypothetical protein